MSRSRNARNNRNNSRSYHHHDLTPTVTPARNANVKRIWEHFDPETLRRVCTLDERAFAGVYGMEKSKVRGRAGSDYYAFKDNGSKILAVAHLDTVVSARQRICNFAETADGMVVYSGALDDRLGAYVILELLPKLGINVDVLLTTGEEQCASTAAYFDAPKDYNWIIEFDRGNTDVVMYQYEDDETSYLVEDSGARVGSGSFSDIAVLDHLGVKAFNWGVGYRDYHGPRSHAFLDDTFKMVDYFMRFHRVNQDVVLPHDKSMEYRGSYKGKYGGSYDWLDYGTNKSKTGAVTPVVVPTFNSGGAGTAVERYVPGDESLEEYLVRMYGEDGAWAARGIEGADAIAGDEDDEDGGVLDPSNEVVTAYLASVPEGVGEDDDGRELLATG